MYHIRKDMQRKGYAKEAAVAVRNWVFKNLPFNEVYSYMKYTNITSAKSAESWGCKFVTEDCVANNKEVVKSRV